MINISDKAKIELEKTLKDKAAENHSIRVYVTGFGWGGPRFGLALDEKQEDDNAYNVDEFEFIISDDIKDQFAPFAIDFAGGWIGKGFVIRSEKGVQSSC